MIAIVLLTLASITMVASSVLIFKYLINFFKNDTIINRLLIIGMFGVLFGVLIDCSRILVFHISKFIDITLDRSLFATKFVLLFVGIAAVIRVVHILNRQSGNRIKYEALIRYLIITLIVIFSIYNLFTFVPVEILGLPGFYVLEIDRIIYIIIIIISILLVLYTTIKLIQIIDKIRDKTIVRPFLIIIFLFSALVLERFYSIGHLFVDRSSTLLILELSILASIAVSSLVMFLKNPTLFEMISTYFCVKSIYLIIKKGGQLIYGHDFQREIESETIDQEFLLLGGFIYAVSQGLEATLNLSGDLELIEVENNYLLFSSGKYILGLAFVTENFPTLKLKLILLLQRFETYFENSLKDWKGDLSKFNLKTVDNWVSEIFRPGERKKTKEIRDK